MSLNATPSANRIHIGIFGRRNAGKSSLINALTGQQLAIVSEHKGTTTDPVQKAMELLPLGPVVLIDTPGLDDEGDLGALRIEKAYQALNKTEIALLVVDASVGITAEDNAILQAILEKKIPCVLALNKADLATDLSPHTLSLDGLSLPADFPRENCLTVSALSGDHIHELKELLAAQLPLLKKEKPLVRDLVSPGDFVVLVVPIDSSAPKGRLILPQQQTIRDLLDGGAVSIVVKDSELALTLEKLPTPPALVITDSQVFHTVSHIVPASVPLLSFSILFARHKGNLNQLLEGAARLDSLQNNDKILISEGCTHHRQCDDIGTVKLPRMLQNHCHKTLQFDFTSGTEFPRDLSAYQLIIHCGACMLNTAEMHSRLAAAKKQAVPMTNYGVAIAHMQGILARCVSLLQS